MDGSTRGREALLGVEPRTRYEGAIFNTQSRCVLAITSHLLFFLDTAARAGDAAIPSALIVLRRTEAAGAFVSPGGREDAAPGCPTVRRYGQPSSKAFRAKKQWAGTQ